MDAIINFLYSFWCSFQSTNNIECVNEYIDCIITLLKANGKEGSLLGIGILSLDPETILILHLKMFGAFTYLHFLPLFLVVFTIFWIIFHKKHNKVGG